MKIKGHKSTDELMKLELMCHNPIPGPPPPHLETTTLGINPKHEGLMGYLTFFPGLSQTYEAPSWIVCREERSLYCIRECT